MSPSRPQNDPHKKKTWANNTQEKGGPRTKSARNLVHIAWLRYHWRSARDFISGSSVGETHRFGENACCSQDCGLWNLNVHCRLDTIGHTPSTAGTFQRKFQKNSRKTPETLSEFFWNLKPPEHFQNSLPLSTAGDPSFSEMVPEWALSLTELVEFQAVLRVSLTLGTNFGHDSCHRGGGPEDGRTFSKFSGLETLGFCVKGSSNLLVHYRGKCAPTTELLGIGMIRGNAFLQMRWCSASLPVLTSILSAGTPVLQIYNSEHNAQKANNHLNILNPSSNTKSCTWNNITSNNANTTKNTSD